MKNLSTALLVFLFSFSLQAQWTQLNDAPFIDHHSNGFGHNGKGYIIKGTFTDFGSFVQNQVWEYDPASDAWDFLNYFPGPGRRIAIGDDMDGKYYYGFGVGFSDLWEYDPETNTFTELPSCPCVERAHPAFVAHNGKIFMGSGTSADGDLNDWWIYDFSTQQWEQKENIPGPIRHHPYQFGIDDAIYVGGGHRDNWLKWDIETETWSEIDNRPAGRVAGTQFSYDNYGFVLAGDRADHGPILEEHFLMYDPQLDRWYELPFELSMGRWAPSSFIIEDELYYFGGLRSGEQEQALFKFDMNTIYCIPPTQGNEISVTKNSAGLIWEPSPSGPVTLLEWRKVGEENWNTIENPQAVLFLEDLEECTDYEWRINANCENGATSNSEPKVFTTQCGACLDFDYCDVSESYQGNIVYIDNVGIGNYENNSGRNGGYQWFMDTDIELYLGQELNLSFTAAFDDPSFGLAYWNAWLDLNGDGVFTNEELIIQGVDDIAVWTENYTIPQDAALGLTRLRIVVDEESLPDACTGLGIETGEVEDYCVRIVAFPDMDNDGFASDVDCDDQNADINPGLLEEPYNGIDDDCDPMTLDDDLDGDGFDLADDCDDQNADINPNVEESVYNGIDDDCDPMTLDDDLDQDGFDMLDDCDDTDAQVFVGATCDDQDVCTVQDQINENCECRGEFRDSDEDGVCNAEDCKPFNANVFPGNVEIPYNGLDDDCDEATRDDDLDGDGFNLADDCDDNDPMVNSAQSEIPYNGLDDDCDPTTLDDDLDGDGFGMAEDCDDTDALLYVGATCDDFDACTVQDKINADCECEGEFRDSDEDGICNAEDCKPFNANVFPGNTEIPYNGLDDDCDENTLDDDLDGDGFNLADDCDDNDPMVNTDQSEVQYNGVDDDCDPTTLDDDLDGDGFDLADDCDDENAAINPGIEEVVYNGVDDDCDPATLDDDLDGDGFDLADDCDDENAAINPSIEEVVYNGIDDDCDPATLDDDLDGDGFDLANDCDDENAEINPSAEEIAYNGLDDDCNEATPDDDLDGDGFGIDEDCDDENSDINPDAEEIANNGIDEDCDGMDLISSLHNMGDATIDIFPNPAFDRVYLNVQGLDQYRVRLYNGQGQAIYAGHNSNHIALNDYPSGIYILEIFDPESKQSVLEKLLISKK